MTTTTREEAAKRCFESLLKGDIRQARAVLEPHIGRQEAARFVQKNLDLAPNAFASGLITEPPDVDGKVHPSEALKIDRSEQKPLMKFPKLRRNPFRFKGQPVPVGPTPRNISVKHHREPLACFMCGGPAMRDNSQVWDLVLGDVQTTARKCNNCYRLSLRDGLDNPELIRTLTDNPYPELPDSALHGVGKGVLKLAADFLDYWPTDEPKEPWAHVSPVDRLSLTLRLSERARPPVLHRSESGQGCRFCGVRESLDWVTEDVCKDCDKDGFTWGEKSVTRGRILRSALGVGAGKDGKRKGLVVSDLDDIGLGPFRDSPLAATRPEGTDRRWGYLLDDADTVDMLSQYCVATWRHSCPGWMVEKYPRPTRKALTERPVKPSGLKLTRVGETPPTDGPIVVNQAPLDYPIHIGTPMDDWK